MNRRSWLQSLAAFFVPATPEKPAAATCLTPAYAGFDGTMRCGGVNVILRRGLVDNPHRYSGVRRNEFAVWKNADKSVSKLLYRNADGKLFDLVFVPMDEPLEKGRSHAMPTH